MTRERRTFDNSFKLEVVRMIKEQGMSFAQVSQTMNIRLLSEPAPVRNYE